MPPARPSGSSRSENEDFVDTARCTRNGRLLTSDWRGKVCERDLASLEVEKTYGHGGRVRLIELSPEEKWLATALEREPLARVWSRASGEVVAELPHEQQIRSLSFSPDGCQLLAASDDGVARLWEVAEGPPDAVP